MEKLYELKPASGGVKIDLGPGEYLVSREESESGVITVTCLPSEQISKDLESKLGSISGEIDAVNESITQLSEKLATLEKEKKGIEKLINR